MCPGQAGRCSRCTSRRWLGDGFLPSSPVNSGDVVHLCVTLDKCLNSLGPDLVCETGTVCLFQGDSGPESMWPAVQCCENGQLSLTRESHCGRRWA